MKTYDNKVITKRSIQNTLRTLNPTKIFRLYHQIYGGEVNRTRLMKFILDFAPSKRVERATFRIAHYAKEPYQINIKAYKEYVRRNIRQIAMAYFREQIRDTSSPYAKRPVMGNTHLYFVSPRHGHDDYNKWRAMPIKGNEQFCAAICKLGDKYFS